MTERSGQFVQGRYVEDLPATMRSTGEPPGPELTAGAPIDPATPVTESTADFDGCAGPGTTGDTGGAGPGASGTPPVEDQIGAASASVTRAVDDVIVAVRTLVGTEEGHRYMEARVDRAGATLASVLRDLQSRVDGTLKKK
jgi:hypothetical protein